MDVNTGSPQGGVYQINYLPCVIEQGIILGKFQLMINSAEQNLSWGVT